MTSYDCVQHVIFIGIILCQYTFCKLLIHEHFTNYLSVNKRFVFLQRTTNNVSIRSIVIKCNTFFVIREVCERLLWFYEQTDVTFAHDLIMEYTNTCNVSVGRSAGRVCDCCWFDMYLKAVRIRHMDTCSAAFYQWDTHTQWSTACVPACCNSLSFAAASYVHVYMINTLSKRTSYTCTYESCRWYFR
jgi:hypothetical protein